MRLVTAHQNVCGCLCLRLLKLGWIEFLKEKTGGRPAERFYAKKYRVVGYIEDTRLGGPIPMAMRNPQLAAPVRKQGGDALLLSSDNAEVMGSFSTANASATGWGSATTFGNTTTFNGGANAFGTGMTMPIVRRSSRYYVIKYPN
jgi:hypothetical protein